MNAHASLSNPGPAQVASMDYWHIFNEATLVMSKARNTDEILDVVLTSLSRMGFSSLMGELSTAGTGMTIRALNLVPVGTQAAPNLIGQYVPLSHLPAYRTVVQDGEVQYLQTPVETLPEWLPAEVLAAAPNLNLNQTDNLAFIAAPVRMHERTRYLILAVSPSLHPEDTLVITAYANLVSAMLENIELLANTETQKKIAETLQEVGRIVSSSLELPIVLDRILEQLAQVIPYNSAAILLERDNVLKLEAGHGFDNIDNVLGIIVSVENNPLYQEIKWQKKPIIINDVLTDPRYTRWKGTEKIRAWIGVPLILADRTIGQISIDSFTKDAFLDSDGSLAFSFAQHVSTAIRNAQLFEQTVETTRELEVLLELAREATTTFDTSEIIAATARHVQEALHADTVQVYLASEESAAESRPLNQAMQLGELSGQAQAHSLEATTRAINSGQNIIVRYPSTVESGGSDVFMVAPLIIKNRVTGAITLSRYSPDTFQQADLDLLARFVLQTAIAVENSRLYAQLERRLNREGLVNTLSRSMSTKFGLGGLAKEIMRTVKTIADADAVAVTLVNLSEGEPYLQFSNDLPVPSIPSSRTLEPSIAAEAIKRQRVVTTSQYRKESFVGRQWEHTNVQGAIAVPITVGDEPLGAIELFTLGRPFAHSSEIVITLDYIGRQAGVAVENALLFQKVNDYAQTLEARVKERTAELERQKDEQATIVESAGDAIIITDVDGVIEYVNSAFTHLTGYIPQEAIGQRPNLLRSGQTPANIYRRLWQTILDGRVWRGEVKNKRKDGTLYDADLTIAPVVMASGELNKFIAIQRDISKIREVDRLKTEFLATAAHELRTPITTILGYAEILQSDRIPISPEEGQAFLGYIYEQAQHLSNLITDLLDVSKIEAGGAFEINPASLSLIPVMTHLVETWRQKVSHTITLQIPDALPLINADQMRLEQVLNNLISNATKYSPQEGEVIVSVTPTPTGLRISIKDHGIGMSLEDQKHIFERFWRANSTSTAVEGTGLGMAIVRHIIEAHGGKIWLSSRKGEGTTVNFILPFENASDTILLIEDEQSILEVQERLLSIEGYHVLTATNGRDGLDLALSEHPDLIVLDLMLPEVDGEEVLRRLKATPSTENIPVFVVSARSALSSIEETFALGAIDFLTKPFDVDEFLGRVKISLNKK